MNIFKTALPIIFLAILSWSFNAFAEFNTIHLECDGNAQGYGDISVALVSDPGESGDGGFNPVWSHGNTYSVHATGDFGYYTGGIEADFHRDRSSSSSYNFYFNNDITISRRIIGYGLNGQAQYENKLWLNATPEEQMACTFTGEHHRVGRYAGQSFYPSPLRGENLYPTLDSSSNSSGFRCYSYIGTYYSHTSCYYY